jgi:hypothetical protein
MLTNRLGYGKRNGARSWYPTLFGWEKGKRLAYFTTGYELSSLMTLPCRSNRHAKDMASEMPIDADEADCEKYV